jgi:hypothetical protein
MTYREQISLLLEQRDKRKTTLQTALKNTGPRRNEHIALATSALEAVESALKAYGENPGQRNRPLGDPSRPTRGL